MFVDIPKTVEFDRHCLMQLRRWMELIDNANEIKELQ
mgnify:CR=1 FL=1